MNRVIYNLRAANGTEHTFEIDLERNHNAHFLPPPPARMELLEFQRCTNCPFESADNLWCPTALDIVPLAEPFANSLSIVRFDVWVHTAERSYFKNCICRRTQLAVRTGNGLKRLPAHGAPQTLAYFHLLSLPWKRQCTEQSAPIWSINTSTIRKATSPMGIEKPGRNLQRAAYRQHQLHETLTQASNEDANINALQSFVSISSVVEMGLDDMLEKMVPLLKKGL